MLLPGQTPGIECTNLSSLAKVPSLDSGLQIHETSKMFQLGEKSENERIPGQLKEKAFFRLFMALRLTNLPPHQGQASGGAGWDLNQKH